MTEPQQHTVVQALDVALDTLARQAEELTKREALLWEGVSREQALRKRILDLEAEVQYAVDGFETVQDEHARIETEVAVLRAARQQIAKLPTREEWLGGQRTQYVQVATVLDVLDLAAPACGDRDRYSPRVCRLPAGHAGVHEDPTFVDVGAAPTVLMDPDDCAKARHGTTRCLRCGQEWDGAR